ncbi:unnamed protein product [Citrullus colocynthis]|uniref:Uncharacterized protein n=1 Tax=Citrullus colocynthis TaxID=252529 RepID=A0ABP0YGB3_9ROSI
MTIGVENRSKIADANPPLVQIVFADADAPLTGFAGADCLGLHHRSWSKSRSEIRWRLSRGNEDDDGS